jgi:hypothetical protein
MTFRNGSLWRNGSRRDGEKGQALVLFVIMLVMLLTTLALVVNGGMVRRSDQELWNALDAGALAGAASLPGNPATATADARKFSAINHPALTAAATTVSFRCLVGDRNNDRQPDVADVPALCNPGAGAVWTCADGKCVAACDPARGHVCNTVVVRGTVPTAYRFGQITGVNGDLTTLESAACSGLCGGDPAVPLDIGFIIDRTQSMSAADLANAKNAALASLKLLDPTKQQVGLAVLGRSSTTTQCSGAGLARGIAALTIGVGTWVTVPYPTSGTLSTNFQSSAGVLNNNSQLVRTINCLDTAPTFTDLGDPLTAMADTLISQGRAGVPKGIIMLTDGAANLPDFRSCKYANDHATEVKARGIELFTIGFGVVGDTCIDIDGTYRGALAAELLANMATGPTTNNGCNDAENADNDHFFCEPRSDSLAGVFRTATTALLGGPAKLVQLPGT